MKRALFLRPARGAARRPRTARRAQRWGAALVAALVFALPATSSAGDATLRMAFANIINGPLDSVGSPYTGGAVLLENLRDVEDTRGVRVAYAVPGYLWLTGLFFSCGGIRTVTGAMQTVPGVLLFPFERDMEEIFSPVENSSALILDWENPIAENEEWYVRWNPVATLVSIPLRFGLNYTRSDY